ncbi:MAG: taurine catabolism dioxygenase TauD [Rhodospirillaceae bacterium]|nr:taurine catabolism dioxygenase TauD [Rhodospirillaceae bacterium]|tara:strand:- start:9149 stop:9991 length:843 start_codon:yes stop_codon:yes gene_type:complete
MKIERLDTALGARISAVNLSVPDGLDQAGLRSAWLDHGVLLFHGQNLSPTALVQFSALFGDLEPPPASETGTRDELAGQPVWYISNVVENGKAIGSLGAGEAEWHTDMSYLPEPPTASILFAQEVPHTGGNTSFADMEAAWAAIPDDLCQAIAGRTIHHDSSTTSVGETRRGYDGVSDVREAPGASHPAIRTHPETGRPSLYLGRRRNAWIEGMDLAESEALLDRLWEHCRRPEFAWTHVWQAGDVVMWDNRRLIHRRDPFEASSRRIMLRTQVAGDRPF